MFRLFKVEGNSLYPYLKQGQRVFCFRLFRFNNINIGDFVVFTKKPYGLMIKRVDDVKDGRFFVKGTDPMSIDSRNFGLLDRAEIQYKLWPFKMSA